MVQLFESGAYLIDGKELIADNADAAVQVAAKTGRTISKEEAAKQTMAYKILQAHNTSGDDEHLKVKFDRLTSHDITFVGIIQTARASGLEKFPVPYVLTNCHNSLCAVGGTINEDDHMFGLSCAQKYGGVYVPPHLAVIHQYAREMLAVGRDAEDAISRARKEADKDATDFEAWEITNIMGYKIAVGEKVLQKKANKK